MELYRCLVDEKTAKNVFSLTCQETSLPIWRRDMFTIKKYLGLQRFRILHDLLLKKMLLQLPLHSGKHGAHNL